MPKVPVILSHPQEPLFVGGTFVDKQTAKLTHAFFHRKKVSVIINGVRMKAYIEGYTLSGNEPNKEHHVCGLRLIGIELDKTSDPEENDD